MAIFLIHTISPTAANWYAPIDVSVITDSVAHAKSLGDVWIDSVANVGAYWRAQKVLSSVTPVAAGGAPGHGPGRCPRISRPTWSCASPSTAARRRRRRAAVLGSARYYEIALDARSLTLSP